MKRVLHVLGLLISVLAIAAVVVYVIRMAGKIDIARFTESRSAIGVVIAALASAAIIPISAIGWRQLLTSCGERRPWSQLAVIMGITQLAKYLPGNVGQHVGRLALASREGLPLGTVAATVLAESILAVLAAAAVGAAGCLAGGAPIVEHWMPGVGRGVLMLSCVALAVGALLAAWFAPRIIASAVRHATAGRVVPRLPSPGALGQAFLLYVGNYGVLGIGITAMAHLVADVQWCDAALLTGSFAMAWILGFFVPGAPAGLGVREGVMLTLLHVTGMQGEAIAVVLGIRVATTLGDILCFIAASAIHFAGRRGLALANIDKDTNHDGT